MNTEKRDDEVNLSDGSEYIPEASPTRKQKTISNEKHRKHDEPAKESSTSTSRSKSNLRKYIRLKGCYNDNYRKLFNTMISEAGHIAVEDDSEMLNPMLSLPPSDLGGTSWSTDEKRILFRAVARYGRDDLPRISSSVNKSEQEVRVYLEHIQKALLQHVRTLHGGLKCSADEMHAAVEVSEECLEELNICADALAWYQFTWEAKQEHKAYGDYWLLDRELADEVEMAIHDDEDDESAREGCSESGGSSQSSSDEGSSLDVTKDMTRSATLKISKAIPATELLNLSNFIELSEKVFMNSKDPDWDWRSFQDAGKPDKSQSKLSRPEESPAIFRTAFDDFHRVAINLTKRIMHTSLFLATSRLRAKDNIKQPLIADPRVGKGDVLAALQILKLKENSFDHWATLPRRHKVDWFYQTDTDNKSKKRQVTEEEAERYLRHEARINHSEIDIIFQTDAPENLEQLSSQDGHRQSNPEAFDYVSIPRTRQLGHEESADTYDQYLELLDVQASRLQEREIWDLLDKDAPSTANLSDLVEPKMPNAIPTIEQGTSSFADWRAWTERRAEWEMEQERSSEDEDYNSMDDQPRFEDEVTLSWISVPQNSVYQEERNDGVESDDSMTGVIKRKRGWSAVKNSGGSKRGRTQSTIDLETTFGMDISLRKRQEIHSPSEMEEAEPPLGEEPAWLQDVEPIQNEPAWDRSPSPTESLGDVRHARFDDSE